MNAHDVVEELVRDTGETHRRVSVRMGYGSTYLKGFIYERRIPRIDTLAKIADACGYDLLLRRRIDDYEIPIDPYDD